jgi:hypothetical protein
VKRLKGPLHLLKDVQSLLLRKFPPLFKVFLKRSSITELIDQIIIVCGAYHLDEFDDIGMGHFAQDTDLIIDKLN